MKARICKVSFSFLLNGNIGVASVDVTLPMGARVTPESCNAEFRDIVASSMGDYLRSQGIDTEDCKNLCIMGWSFYE